MSKHSPEIVPYAGWEHCLRLRSGKIQLLVTLDTGPRIISFAEEGQPNMLGEFEDQLGQTGGDTWLSYGGHRLWHAPEQKPRTYQPDNNPVAHEWRDGQAFLTAPVETATGVQKELVLSFPADGTLSITHRIYNRGMWPIELAPWALTVMCRRGVAIVPQPPHRPHTQELLPSRPLVLWPYTDMSDPCWQWGKRFIFARQDPTRTTSQKIGASCAQGWAAYYAHDYLFVKTFPFDRDARYVDFGCNFELYLDPNMLELESLGPLTLLEPDSYVEHHEEWHLVPLHLSTLSEDALQQAFEKNTKLHGLIGDSQRSAVRRVK